MKYFIIAFLLILSWNIQAQTFVSQTFKDRHVINSHSVEMLPARQFDFRIAHRFGDMLGDAGGWSTLYGIDNASDILVGGEFGISDHLNAGLSRTKGAGELRQNINTFLKARLMQQQMEGRNPFSVVVLGMASYSTMKKTDNLGAISSFPKASHRLAYHMQLMLARKFSPGFSLQLNTAWTYRNLVYTNDRNDLLSIGLSTRVQMTKSTGLIIDANYPISSFRTAENNFYPSLSFGVEFETGGGHVFQINLTNSQGLMETDYIPYTTSNWADGQFRFGFTISRMFNI